MQVELIPIPMAKDDPIDTHYTLTIGGKEIGTIDKKADTKSYRWHVSLYSQLGINIYQGFGMTTDEALRNAIDVGRQRRKTELAELNELENVIWGDHELN